MNWNLLLIEVAKYLDGEAAFHRLMSIAGLFR